MRFYILYPESSLNSLSSSSFLVVSLEFSIYDMMSSAKSDNFIFSFPVWIPLIYFSCVTAVARTSNILLIKSNKSRHLCLVPDLRENVFSFSLLHMI